MTSLYSIQGMHQITSQGNDFYKGRLWPGPAPSADPKTANEKAFNIIFSVFVQEMLHLQLASNIATAIGVTPTYTGPALQNADHGWICYGPTLTVIPNIIDLEDTKEHKDVVVNIGPVSKDQLKLFLAIEEPEKVAKDYIDPDKLDKYFPKVPFANWGPKQPLPMFGTIGWMYQCYKNYLDIGYSDGSTLWEASYSAGQKKGAQQNDMFNNFVAGGHPMREFMGFELTVALTYWNAEKQAKQTVLFPMPSMGGSGDRMAICWAVFGKAPDLSIGLAPPAQNTFVPRLPIGRLQRPGHQRLRQCRDLPHLQGLQQLPRAGRLRLCANLQHRHRAEQLQQQAQDRDDARSAHLRRLQPLRRRSLFGAQRQ